MGHSLSGKSSFLDAFIKHHNPIESEMFENLNNTQGLNQVNIRNDSARDHKQMRSVINVYKNQGSSRQNQNTDTHAKYIIFTEIPDTQLQSVLDDQNIIGKCDAIAFLYENDNEHIEFLKDWMAKLPGQIPKMIMLTKTDNMQQVSE
jgi:hypothetical protein